MSSSLPHFSLYIAGQFCKGHQQRVMESINPATGKIWAEFDCADPEDVERAVLAAKTALQNPAWRDMSQTARGKLLLCLGDLIAENAEKIGLIETQDSGKLAAETVSQTAYVADYYRYYAGLADKIEGALLPIDKPDMCVFTKPEPIGIVAAIVPWNAQMFLAATKIAPALAAGCAIIVKASEIAPAPMLEFAKLIDRAGFPPGVISVLTGDAPGCAIPLTRHPLIDRIAFTGGPETARHVIRNSAENFAVTTMELGGKSPILVFDDADIESAANGLIAGNFGASGQSCVAGSRGFIQRGIYKKLVETISRKASDIIIGDPSDSKTHIGPVCTEAQIATIEKTIKAAKNQGATICFGGKRHDKPGFYFEPTLLECPSPDCESFKIEMFGPVMSLTPFDDEEEAIRGANDSDYGLGAGIFTSNIARAHRVSNRIRSGIIWVNTYRAISPIAPFGGFNHSGYGREAGQSAILDYTRSKTIWINTASSPMANPFTMR